jgi:hypothetical protein
MDSKFSTVGRITRLEVFDAAGTAEREVVHIGVADANNIFNKVMFWRIKEQPIPFKIGQRVRITVEDSND